jgi:purine nucleoside phosphorylase
MTEAPGNGVGRPCGDRGKGPRQGLARLAAWAPDLAVIVGSGMASITSRLVVDDELAYDELGWPATSVPGHDNRLLLARGRTARGRELRLALACGRPHRYEGWTDGDLERAVRDLCACGVERSVMTNAAGGLGETCPGTALVCHEVVDLQAPPPGREAPRLAVCSHDEAARAAVGLCQTEGEGAPPVPCTAGVYVSVAGPQYETPAEAQWLARYGDAVGMSAAPELRAALGTGMTCLVLALVVNRSGADASHDDVLVAAARLSERLAVRMLALVEARWPELA